MNLTPDTAIKKFVVTKLFIFFCAKTVPFKVPFLGALKCFGERQQEHYWWEWLGYGGDPYLMLEHSL